MNLILFLEKAAITFGSPPSCPAGHQWEGLDVHHLLETLCFSNPVEYDERSAVARVCVHPVVSHVEHLSRAEPSRAGLSFKLRVSMVAGQTLTRYVPLLCVCVCVCVAAFPTPDRPDAHFYIHHTLAPHCHMCLYTVRVV